MHKDHMGTMKMKPCNKFEMGALKYVYVSHRELLVIDNDLFGKKIFANRSPEQLQVGLEHFIFKSLLF